MRTIMLFGLATAGLGAQAFTDLATTTDGSTVYFASRLKQKGTDQVPDVGKIFAADGASIYAGAQPQCTVMPALPTRDCALLSPDVSGDGKLIAYTFREYDLSGSLNTTRGVVAQAFSEHLEDNSNVRLSRNGRFVLAYTDVLFSAPRLFDSASGATTILTGFSVVGDARQTIADDGSVVLHDGSLNTVVWKAGIATKLNLKHQSANARIDRNARTIVYEWNDTQYHLSSYDIASGIETGLWSEGSVPPSIPNFQPSPLYYQPSISDDGRYVLIQAAYNSRPATKDLWILATDGSTARQLTRGAGVTSDVLSGNGVIAYAATADNRLLRINTVTVDRFEIVPRMPVLAKVTQTPLIAPGDYLAAGGGGLENAQVLVNGEPAWVIAAHNGLVAFRIPWDVPIGQPVPITVASDSPFDPGSFTAAVQAANPHPWFAQPVHQDFSDVVKPESPARQGEIVHLYMTGLGIIDPLLPLDQPAPAGTPVRALTPLSCSVNNINAPVQFAGVAPGQTWIYQADVQIPAGASTGTLTCGGATFPLAVAGSI